MDDFISVISNYLDIEPFDQGSVSITKVLFQHPSGFGRSAQR